MNKASISFFAFLFSSICLFLFMACNKDFEELEFITATTLRAVPVGVNTVQLSGTLTNLNLPFEPNEGAGKSYGFLIATDESALELDNPNATQIDISTPYISDTSFIHILEVESLSTTYFYTAFAKFGDRIHYGDELSFNLSQNVRLALSDSVLIQNGIGTFNMALFLSFQDTISNLGVVYSSETKEPIPGSTNAITRTIQATNDDGGKEILSKELSFNTTYYARAFAQVKEELILSDTISFKTKDGWQLVSTIEKKIIESPMGLGTPNFAWLGMGCAIECEADVSSSFWKYDPSFTEIPDTFQLFESNISGRRGAINFVLNDKIYYGFGMKGNRIMADFWQLDLLNPSQGWKDITLPEKFRRSNGVVLVNEKLNIAYIGTGDLDATNLDDFQVFNPDNISEPPKGIPALPLTFEGVEYVSGRTRAYTFELNEEHYVGGGFANGVNLDDLYVLRDGEWQFVHKTPFNPRQSAVAFSFKGKAYVALGNDGTLEGQFYDIWELNSDLEWTQKTSMPDEANFRQGTEIAFVTQGSAFIGGTNDKNNTLAIWEYFPEE